MSQTPANEAAKPLKGTWASWLAIAAVAVVMGLLLPQLMPGQAALEPAAPKAAVKEKGKLDYAAPALPEVPSAQSMLIRLGLGTAVVLGLCVATLWGVRRWMYPMPANGSMPREMRLMETLQLGNRCAMHLVHLGKQPILVGVDGAGIKTIVPLAPPFEDVLGEAETAPDAETPFAAPKRAA